MTPVTMSLSQIFDYPAYAKDAEKSQVSECVGPTFSVAEDLNPPTLPDPLYDVQNVVLDETVPNGILSPCLRPAFHRLIHEEESAFSPPPRLIRREDTEPALDFSQPVAGPSRSASQRRVWQELVRMNSSFGSEFGGSDAVFYGGSERDEGSVFDVEDHMEFVDEECDEDVVMHDDCDCDGCDCDGCDCDGCDCDGCLSDEEASGVYSEDEEEERESEGDDSSDEGCHCPEATEATPWDIPPTTLPADFPSPSGLRRSTRVRRHTQLFVLPSSPKKDKGKGKAVAREAPPPPPSRRTSTKRARSPSPRPDDAGELEDSPASKRPRHDRRSDAETQGLTIIPRGVRTEFPCGFGQCTYPCSLHNMKELVGHFGGHYTGEEKKRKKKDNKPVPCRWGPRCAFKGTYAAVIRHLKTTHFKLKWRCPGCGGVYSRPCAVRRHEVDTPCPSSSEKASSKKAEGSSKKGKGRRK